MIAATDGLVYALLACGFAVFLYLAIGAWWDDR